MGWSKKGVKGKWQASVLKKPSFKKKKTAHIKGGIKAQEELKFLDTARATYQPTQSAGVVQLLNGIAQGDDYNSRDGRQATMRSVHVRGTVENNGVGAGALQARLLLVWDNAANGAALTVAQVMSADDAIAFPLIDNANRFTILRDWHEVIGATNNTATQAYAAGSNVMDIDFYVKLSDLTQFSGTGATIASIQSGSLYLVMLSSINTAGGTLFKLATRVRFSEP